MPPYLDPQRVTQALTDAQNRQQYPIYQYPWHDLDSLSTNSDNDFIWVLGYGSLLSVASASRTIETSKRAMRLPVIAPGARRRFSYNIPQSFLSDRYKVTDGTRYAALDCDVTYDPNDLLNGILTRVFQKDITAFRKREYAYDLKPVPVFEWSRPEAPYKIAYILDCPPVGTTDDHPFATDIPPQPEYYQLCRDGAEAISKDFLETYLDSTYLGDGTTSIRTWEKPQSTP